MPRGGPRLRDDDGRLNQIGPRVRARRLALRVKQDELCARLARLTEGRWNPAWQDVSRVENGSRLVSDLEVLALARALECPAGWLLTGDPVGGPDPA